MTIINRVNWIAALMEINLFVAGFDILQFWDTEASQNSQSLTCSNKEVKQAVSFRLLSQITEDSCNVHYKVLNL